LLSSIGVPRASAVLDLRSAKTFPIG